MTGSNNISGSSYNTNDYNINVNELKRDGSKNIINDILQGGDIFTALNVLKEGKKTAQEKGNEKATNWTSSLNAYLDPIASAASYMKQEDRQAFINKNIDLNGDGKFDEEDIKLLDANGNGFIEKDEMQTSVEKNLYKKTQSADATYQMGDNALKASLRENSIFDENGKISK